MVFTPVSFLLYLSHLYAFAGFALIIVSIELPRAFVIKRRGVELRTGWFSGLSSVFVVLIGPTTHFLFLLNESTTPSLGATEFGGLISRFVAFSSTITLFPGVNREIDTVVPFLVSISLLLFFPILMQRFGPPRQIDRRYFLAVAVLLLVSLLMPWKVADNAVAHVRFPIIWVALLIAVTNWKPAFRVQIVFAVLVLGIFVLRVGILDIRWSQHDAEVRELLSATADLGREDRLLVGEMEEEFHSRRHWHSSTIVARETGVFVPSLFTRTNILMPQPSFEERTADQTPPIPFEFLIEDVARNGVWTDPGEIAAFWTGWRNFYTHLLVLKEVDESIPEELNQFATPIAEGSFFVLYEIIPPE